MNPTDLLAHPTLYRLWQSPFARQKLAPVLASDVLRRASSVLDVGCGPGTNAPVFQGVDRYVGVDISERYIAYASGRFRGDFRVVDVTAAPPSFGRFDLVLMNSLMHHLDDYGAKHLLASLPDLVAERGEIHIIDLVIAEEGIPRRLALADRGKFVRTMRQWEDLVGSVIEIADLQPFTVRLAKVPLWELVHIRAAPFGT